MQVRTVLAGVRIQHILLLAFALRLVWALAVPVLPVSDSFVYDMLARRIAAGQGYTWPDGSPTAYWPVGTAALYGALFLAFGVSAATVAATNVVLGTALVAAIYALARTTFSRNVALVAAFASAIWPTWIAFTSVLASELPANLCFVAGLACALSGRWSWWVRVTLSTVLLVGATYFRANMMPFILLVPLLVAIQDRRPAQFLPQGALALFIAALLIAPWALRNERALGTAVLMSTNFGVNLWIGNNPQGDGGYMEPPATGAERLSTDEVTRNQIYLRYARDYIYSHPVRYAQLCVRRLVLSLDRETFGVAWNERGLPAAARRPLKIVMSGYWYVVFFLSLAGLAAFVWRKPANLLSPFLVVPVAAMASPVFIMASERYHYPIAPFVAIFAAYALVQTLGNRMKMDGAVR